MSDSEEQAKMLGSEEETEQLLKDLEADFKSTLCERIRFCFNCRSHSSSRLIYDEIRSSQKAIIKFRKRGKKLDAKLEAAREKGEFLGDLLAEKESIENREEISRAYISDRVIIGRKELQRRNIEKLL